jgi:hypothetical protein
MSKWEDSFKKSTTDSGTCNCSDNQGLFVPNRQLSALVAGLLFLSFCIFITGYFLGKKYSVEQFTHNMHDNSFDDNHSVSLSMANDVAQCDSDISLVTNAENDMTHAPAREVLVLQEPIATINQDIVLTQVDQQKQYYAQLIGFGTEKAAQQFVKKLSSNGIVTEIKKRVSKTVKGRTSYWYQVVTTAYSNKNDLARVVDKLVKEEKLRDVCIRVC